jgi:DNA anti-recombination protein RmuC
MSELEIIRLITGVLLVGLISALYIYKITNNKLKAISQEYKNLAIRNDDINAENIRLKERTDYQQELLKKTDIAKDVQEVKLKQAQIEKQAAESKEKFIKANERLETKQEATSEISNENQEKIGFLFGNANVQGEYGENSLELVFKEVYFAEGVHYFKEKVFPYSDINGKSASARPDFVVPRPSKDGSGLINIIIDAKTPLNDFHEWDKAQRANVKNSDLKKLEDNFIKKIHGHAKTLAERNYPNHVKDAFDKVIMYVPIEEMAQLVSTSRKTYKWDNKDQTIGEYLAGKNIWIHSRLQILGTLDLVKHMFDMKNQTDHIKSIVSVAKDLVKITHNIKRGTEKYIENNEKETKKMKKVMKDNNTDEYVEKVDIFGLSDDNKNINNNNKTVLHLVEDGIDFEEDE